MVKIISCKSLGIQTVYDIGVEKNHNFILENGAVASNCFNKSHSTAYAYVTYQTTYLKANYPVEYMAALLTSNSGDTDKVQKYIATCLTMNIPIEQVDINHSVIDFAPLDTTILFGFCAVRNLGLGASECILEARNNGGEFKSLADLCDRVDLHTVSRRALETLILCGGFDKIEPNRNQLIHDLDVVLDWSQSRLKERASGQVNLFDWSGLENNEQASNKFDSVPKAAKVADFSQQEKLNKEKELLGFYVSDHPLKSVRSAMQVLAPINLSELEAQSKKALLCAVVMISSIKPITTKKGDRMAIVKLEDLTGQTEAVVFPRTFEQIGSLLVTDARLIVWGKLDRKDDDELQLIIENAQLIDKVQMLMVELTIEQAVDTSKQNQLRSILQEQSGDKDKANTPVLAIVTAINNRQLVRFGRQYWVQNCNAAVQSLTTANFMAYAQPLTNFT
ncbi:helix-hairpin-helix domain-containing protein [Chlorogloea sp. CCALA 695]|uniref:helix-hairpin-helix domain-containing protein n=1 Tax=Chlorogloea sp. CCALA 695 TaxID=2107693 RepID=UPI000D06C78E|nr:OB-fold nucleic acid binding domain-containing protein [Chlorogloea sp. CCALA 695]PSB31516.1 trans-splicing intein-formed DNA polymerase III subunit alpha C-terminal partner DnaE-C [Chlorogloea sp. CCALA 695]